MDQKILSPFIASTEKVLKVMARTDVQAGTPYIRDKNCDWGGGDVTAIIGMAGDTLTGNLIISFDEESILEIVSKMLMEEFTEINQDIIDAAGEITNIITGGTKAELGEQGLKFDMATPVMLSGAKLDISQHTKFTSTVIPFETSKGKFYVEINLHPTNE